MNDGSFLTENLPRSKLVIKAMESRTALDLSSGRYIDSNAYSRNFITSDLFAFCYMDSALHRQALYSKLLNPRSIASYRGATLSMTAVTTTKSYLHLRHSQSESSARTTAYSM